MACQTEEKNNTSIFCIFDQMFRRNGHNCYYNECQNLIFGRHPILAISGLFVFSYRTFDYYSNNPHNRQFYGRSGCKIPPVL